MDNSKDLPTKANPLMEPIHHNERIYLASQRIHADYRRSHGGGGKYRDLKDFNRLIRSVEAFPLYLERGDIVELTRAEAGADLAPAFKATFGKPIMLISATFQAELIHHLDDELSKQMAVAASEQTAKQARLGKASLKDTIAAISMIGKIVAEVPGVKPAMVAAATLACIAENTGLALDTMRQTLPAEAPEAVGKLNASQIGKELGISAIAANRRLALLGFQRKPEGGDWELTEAGTTHGEAIPFTRNGHAGYQILWNQSVIEVLREAV